MTCEASVIVSSPAPRVGALTFHRPDKLNAIDSATLKGLRSALAGLVADPEVRVIIVRGSSRSFTVGADVSPGAYASAATAEDDRLVLMSMVTAFLDFWDAPKPVIAQVEGWCLGIGNILAACCDLVVAADDATFGWPKLPLGAGFIGPSWIWAVGARKAKELSYQVGSEVSGEEAHRLGFVNHAYPAEEVAPETLALACRIAKTPSDLLRIKKSAFNKAIDRMGFRETLLDGAAWDALSHTAPSVAQTGQDIVEVGIAGAIRRLNAEH